MEEHFNNKEFTKLILALAVIEIGVLIALDVINHRHKYLDCKTKKE